MTTERGTRDETAEKKLFVYVTPRVGILDDGSWVVYWKKTLESGGTKLVPHYHPDFLSVLGQNQAVIQAKIGVPVEGTTETPEMGISLTDVRDRLLIQGSVQRSQGLANTLTNLISLSEAGLVSSMQFAKVVDDALKTFGPKPQNPIRKSIKRNFTNALASDSENVLVANTANAVVDLHALGSEGIRIVASLLNRRDIILKWADTQELKIDRLRQTLGSALNEAETAKKTGYVVRENTIDMWASSIIGYGNVVDPLRMIIGEPYQSFAQRSDFIGLKKLEHVFKDRDADKIITRFEQVYAILIRWQTEKPGREIYGKLDAHRSSKPLDLGIDNPASI